MALRTCVTDSGTSIHRAVTSHCRASDRLLVAQVFCCDTLHTLPRTVSQSDLVFTSASFSYIVLVTNTFNTCTLVWPEWTLKVHTAATTAASTAAGLVLLGCTDWDMSSAQSVRKWVTSLIKELLGCIYFNFLWCFFVLRDLTCENLGFFNEIRKTFEKVLKSVETRILGMKS